MSPRSLISLNLTFALLLASPAAFAIDVRFCTNRGAIDVAIDEQRAPLHAANFLNYMNTGFYNGTVFHRVVRGSMVQGGSFDQSLERRPAGEPVPNESGNGLSNVRGTIAASRSADPNSASSQFFFNLTDNSHLDAQAATPGYTVFGRVTSGLEVLDSIAALPVRRAGGLEDVPQPLISVLSVSAIEQPAVFGLSIVEDPAQLAANLERARARNDAAGVLAAIDALAQSCTPLEPEQRLAEAEAAIALGFPDRARYSLEQYLESSGAFGAGRARAQALYAGLPDAKASRSVEDLIRQCRMPETPTIPDGRFSDQRALSAAESDVRRHRQLGEIYIECIDRSLDSNDLSAAETDTLVERHNDMVVELTAVAMRFNRAVAQFRGSGQQPFQPGLN